MNPEKPFNKSIGQAACEAASLDFKWRHFQADFILLCVRWYLRYPLSYRHLEEMMRERGLQVAHTTIEQLCCSDNALHWRRAKSACWVVAYSPVLNQRCRLHLRPANDSWRLDETYIKVKGDWKHLYRAIDSNGNTIDFLLTANKDTIAGRKIKNWSRLFK